MSCVPGRKAASTTRSERVSSGVAFRAPNTTILSARHEQEPRAVARPLELARLPGARRVTGRVQKSVPAPTSYADTRPRVFAYASTRLDAGPPGRRNAPRPAREATGIEVTAAVAADDVEAARRQVRDPRVRRCSRPAREAHVGPRRATSVPPPAVSARRGRFARVATT